MSTVLRFPIFKSSANAFCDHYQQSRKEGTLFIMLNAFHSNAQFLSFFVVCHSLTGGDARPRPPFIKAMRHPLLPLRCSAFNAGMQGWRGKRNAPLITSVRFVIWVKMRYCSNDIVTILEGAEVRIGFYDRGGRDQPRGHPEGAEGPEGCP